jgi:hypothetical protein
MKKPPSAQPEGALTTYVWVVSFFPPRAPRTSPTTTKPSRVPAPMTLLRVRLRGSWEARMLRGNAGVSRFGMKRDQIKYAASSLAVHTLSLGTGPRNLSHSRPGVECNVQYKRGG